MNFLWGLPVCLMFFTFLGPAIPGFMVLLCHQRGRLFIGSSLREVEELQASAVSGP